jgi:predicted porin
MKKTLISVAVLGAMSSAAFAQSNVTIYGIVDAGIVAERGGKDGNVTKVSSGVANASRIGFRGTEDLGGGLSAVFQLETGFGADTGALDNATNTLFNRQAFVGLSSKTAGAVTLGRQYTPWYNTLSQVADPFAAGLAGSAKNLFGASGNNVRFSNSINYKSPNYSGFTAEAQYGLGEQPDSSTQRSLGLGVGYEANGLNVRLSHNARNTDAPAVGATPYVNRNYARSTLLAVNYQFPGVKAFFAYGKDKGPSSSPVNGVPAFSALESKDSDTALLGVSAPVSAAGTVIASYIRKDDNEVANRDANQIALGYTHSLSKRTNAYVAYAKINNKRGAIYTVGNNSEAGNGNKAFNVGVKHLF